MDANTLTATIDRGSQRKAECAIRLGGRFRDGGIRYSSDASGRGNSYNEQLTVDNDDQSLFFCGRLDWRSITRAKRSCPRSKARSFFWEMLVKSLQ